MQLQTPVLELILALAEDYVLSISEIAGGGHSASSRHYVGDAIDINLIDSEPVNASHPDVAEFMQRCRDLGCTEVLGPGDPGHNTHVHAAPIATQMSVPI